MATYIERIELSNYRSCQRTAVDLDKQLSVLIGVNGSGKSNLLNGILLLKKILRARHRFPEEEQYFLSGCKLKVWFKVDHRTLPYQARIKYTTNERNVDEVRGTVEKWNFKEFTGQDTWVDDIHLSAFTDLEQFSSQVRSFKLSQAELRLLRRPILSKDSLTPLRKVYDYVTGINYYSASQFTDPSKCPTSFELEGGRISPRTIRFGEHLRFIFDLYTSKQQGNSKYNEFLSVVGNEGINLIDTIDFAEIDVPSTETEVRIGGKIERKEINRLLVVPSFIVRGTKLSPNQLSEGTFKTLAVLFYLITDTSRLLLLEEPEVCIHHGLLGSIVEMIKTFSRRKQIIVSTHSDFVLDALDPANVFIVKYDPNKGTIVRHVPKSMSVRDYQALKDYLDTTGNLGEYWRHGELEK